MRFLITEDVCAITSASPRSVQKWVSDRRIPHRRLEGVRRIFFVEEEVLAWIESGGQLELEVTETRSGRVVKPKHNGDLL